ncbi:MAG: hypothetical protein ACE5HP_11005 [Gemmatimonadota bacterium]
MLDCDGNLLALQANENQYAVKEIITRGTSCVTGGTIRFTHDAAAGTLRYRWFHPRSGTVEAEAMLTRKK